MNNGSPDSPVVRLGDGELSPAKLNSFAWREFFAAMQRRAPEAMQSLVTIAGLTKWAELSDGRLDAATEEALADWADQWGVPWIVRRFNQELGFSYLVAVHADMPTAQWCAQQIRTNVRIWRADSALAGRWIGLSDGMPESGWKVKWNDNAEPELVWPSIEWHPREERESDFRDRVEEYIQKLRSLAGTVKTPATYRESDFDALVLEHVAQMKIPDVVYLLSDEVSDEIGPTRDLSSTRKRSRQLADLIGLRLRRRDRGRPEKAED